MRFYHVQPSIYEARTFAQAANSSKASERLRLKVLSDTWLLMYIWKFGRSAFCKILRQWSRDHRLKQQTFQVECLRYRSSSGAAFAKTD